MRGAEVPARVIKPAVAGAMRARKARSRQAGLTRWQWAAFIGVAIALDLAAHALNDLVEQRLGPAHD